MLKKMDSIDIGLKDKKMQSDKDKIKEREEKNVKTMERNIIIQRMLRVQDYRNKLKMEELEVKDKKIAGCQFKNIGEYIYNNITELSKIKSEKDQIKKDTKDSKTKIKIPRIIIKVYPIILITSFKQRVKLPLPQGNLSVYFLL